METASRSITDINVVSNGNCKRELSYFHVSLLTLKMKHVCFM
jgi:hypothetical protein